MMVGKLSVMLEKHPTLGEIFVIRANGNNAYVFDISGDQMVLRVTKDTALLLSQLIDEELNHQERSNETH